MVFVVILIIGMDIIVLKKHLQLCRRLATNSNMEMVGMYLIAEHCTGIH